MNKMIVDATFNLLLIANAILIKTQRDQFKFFRNFKFIVQTYR